MVNDIIIPYIKYLWGMEWIFGIANPFTLLYFIIGPTIIWRIKPYFSPYKRYLLIFLSLVISVFILVIDYIYISSFWCLEGQTFADPLGMPVEEKHEVYHYSTSWKFFSIIVAIFCSPLWGGVRIAWRIYHRKTIKEMGEKYRWKIFDNITIFLSLVWFIYTPFIAGFIWFMLVAILE